MPISDHTTRISYVGIPDAPGYRVGDDGSLWSQWNSGGRITRYWRRLKLGRWGVGRKAYVRATIKVNGIKRQFLMHRLVAECFIGPAPSPDMEVLHWDGKPRNNRLGNLYWGTPKQNAADRERHGRTARGTRSPHAKLDDASAVEAMKMLVGGRRQADVARHFGVRQPSIAALAIGKSWIHLDEVRDLVAAYAAGDPFRRSAIRRSDIPTIRGLIGGGETLSAIAIRYGVGIRAISDIRDRKTWKHIP